MGVSEATYRRVALEDPEGKWELVCGRLRRKPEMTTEHNQTARRLGQLLSMQLDIDHYSVGTDSAKVRVPDGRYRIPDLCVIPMALVHRLQEVPGTFETYDEPLPLIVEVWSPSTGDSDVQDKLREYQQRGDLEIWRIHPYERSLTAWRRQPDGTYTETRYTSGVVPPAFLPAVRVELERLFG